MAYRIDPKDPRGTSEYLATVGALREAIDTRAKLNQLIDLRVAFKQQRDWATEEAHLTERFKSPLLNNLLRSLSSSGVSLQSALSISLRFVLNAR